MQNSKVNLPPLESTIDRGMEIFKVNAFTDKPYCGNPAAVCIVGEQHVSEMTEGKMQDIAAEMKLAETAFVSLVEGNSTFKDGTQFNLRWFTPKCEVPLCGHATLATASVIFSELGNPNDKLEFKTLGGVLVASRNGDFITLDFPEASSTPVEPARLQELLKHTVGDLPLADIEYSTVRQKMLVRLADSVGRGQLEQLSPDTGAMLQASNGGIGRIKGVAVTVKGNEGYDFFSRYFGPWVGIPEDHVSAATHTLLANYWSRQLGKREMLARQCSPRGGDLKVTIGESGRVYVAGKACITVKGHLLKF